MPHHPNPRRSAGPGGAEPGARRTRRPATVALSVIGAVVLVTGVLVAVTLGHSSNAVASSAPASTAASPSAVASGTVSTRGFPTGGTGIFTDRCAYSHEAADDPIMYPGRAGASMHHDFFGNTGTTASSTAASLLGGATTCTTSADSSAYWAPVLEQDGRVLTPGTALIYWRRPTGEQAAVHTVAVGLQLIAGDEAATAPQSTSVISWGCAKAKAKGSAGTASGPKPGTATPHACPAGRDIRLTVFFPSCWDGKNLAGMGQTNVVYPVDHACPSSHPVQIPQIVFHVAYPTSTATGLTLSTSPAVQGSIDTAHIDFINGWDQARLNADVAACDATSTRCGPVTGPDATPRGPRPPRRLSSSRR